MSGTTHTRKTHHRKGAQSWTKIAEDTWHHILKPTEEMADKDSPRPETPPDGRKR